MVKCFVSWESCAFVHSLYACAGWGDMESLHHTVSLLNAKRDLACWWKKIISISSMQDPHFMSVSIAHIRRNVQVDRFIISDASTSVGCGGWLSPSNINEETDTPVAQAFIRWTDEEKAAFDTGINGKGIDFNVVEYFSVVYLILL